MSQYFMLSKHRIMLWGSSSNRAYNYSYILKLYIMPHIDYIIDCNDCITSLQQLDNWLMDLWYVFMPRKKSPLQPCQLSINLWRLPMMHCNYVTWLSHDCLAYEYFGIFSYLSFSVIFQKRHQNTFVFIRIIYIIYPKLTPISYCTSYYVIHHIIL